MKIIIPFGKPGAGKGTLISKFMEDNKNWRTLSTGAVIRKAIKDETALGMVAKSYAEAGKLAPDDLVVGIVMDALDELKTQNIDGIFLDGFPRTSNQARMMISLGIKPTMVVVVDVPDIVVIDRLSKRIECPNCGATFSKGEYNHPKVEWKCDKCGTELRQRKDDQPEVVKERLTEYAEKTAPVLDVLKQIGIPVEKLSACMTLSEII